MPKGPPISVIMPVYNTERFVDEAIRSVLSQRGVSFELLVADDASTDRTWLRVARHLKNRRVRAWGLRSHRGAAGARNFLIAQARGKYISICDADDVMLPGNLAHSVRILEQNPKVGVVYGDLQRIDSSGRLGPVHRIFGPEEGWDLFREGIWHGGTMIRRSILKRLGGYRNILWPLEDRDLLLRLAEKTKFRCHGRGVLYRYRRWKPFPSPQVISRRQRMFRWILQDAIRRRYGRRLRLVKGGVISR